MLDVANQDKGGYSRLTYITLIPQLGRRSSGIIAVWIVGVGSCPGECENKMNTAKRRTLKIAHPGVCHPTQEKVKPRDNITDQPEPVCGVLGDLQREQARGLD